MGIILDNCHAIGCKTGFLFEGDVNATMTNSTAQQCGEGFVVRPHAQLMRQLGLPEETDAQRLAAMLREVLATPPAKKVSKVKELAGWVFEGVKEAPDYTLKLLQIANHPQVQQLIQMLSS
ncbi:hypothetical protein [Pseudomonas oryzihabitans]|uniref:hypothetical protein n=1 Tax=Pseudomonas oryzihabitans TaxID=47885 RepID=UPI003F9AE600